MDETQGCQPKLFRAHQQVLPSLLKPVAILYVTELTRRMSEAWCLAGDTIMKAQVHQKQQHARACIPILQLLKKVSECLSLCLQPSQAWHTSWQDTSMVLTCASCGENGIEVKTTGPAPFDPDLSGLEPSLPKSE